MEQILQFLSSGADVVIFAIWYALYKLDKRVLKLEWKAEAGSKSSDP